MKVVRYINKEPHVIGEVSTINEFYKKYMKPNRVIDMDNWIKTNTEERCHIITRHSSHTGDALFLLEYLKTI